MARAWITDMPCETRNQYKFDKLQEGPKRRDRPCLQKSGSASAGKNSPKI